MVKAKLAHHAHLGALSSLGGTRGSIASAMHEVRVTPTFQTCGLPNAAPLRFGGAGDSSAHTSRHDVMTLSYERCQ